MEPGRSANCIGLFGMQVASALSNAIAVVKGPIASGSIIGLALRLSGLALMFAQAVIAARLLGAADYGVVTLLLAIAQIASAIVLFGYGSYAVAEIPRAMKLGDTAIVSRFLRQAINRIAVLSLLLAPLAYGLGVALLGKIDWALALGFLIVIPVLAGIQLVRGISLGLGRPAWGIAPGEVIRPALLVCALITTAAFAKASSASFIALYMVTAALALGMALPGLKGSNRTGTPAPVSSQVDKRTWDRAALPFLGIHLASILQLELATLMLGLLADPEAVGLFQPIARIAMLLTLPTYALSLAFNPRVAELYAEGDRAQIKSLAQKHTLVATVLVGLAGLAIGLGAPFLLWLFGAEFTHAAPLLWFLVGGRLVQAACGPGAELLAMTGRSNRALRCLAINLALEAGLALLLIPAYGLTGAAIAVALGLVVRGILLAAASRSALGIGFSDFWRRPEGAAPSV